MWGFGGLPGGSPGPDAEGSWKVLLFFLLVSLVIGAAFLWWWRSLAAMFDTPGAGP